ncbi:LysR family transcriptional regulator [Xanthomonas theicola]|uniref:Transcriptional regulator n=1 Tax=Xanthomonas theicola TaxID=56464 RepID=A0A2S6ZLC9_9XANT|nr:LysR family transcriptional regulator [Xanthomonas theicola]PPT92979.1 transcriptional regulator [Xanthomonas theicola]QNH23794.1 LysR family transcriptional regulator [Xanthomonas theicola]
MSSLRRLPSLNALRAFEAAARLRSVGRAAAELHVTHGAVSRQIRLLEEELGLALLQREGRGIRPTAAGERLREAAGGAFAQLQDAVAELRRPARPSALVLGCPGSILARWMIPRLQALQRDLPALTLHLSAHEGEFGADLDGLDAALLLGQAPWPDGWQVQVLAPERIGAVLSPALPHAQALAASPPSALLRQRLLHTASRPQAWPAWAQAHGLDPAALRYGTGFEHLYYLLEAALAGIGVAIAPQPLVADELVSGRLLAPWGFTDTGGQWALCATSERDDPRIDALAGWLRMQLC